jgi:hypothetical protein
MGERPHKVGLVPPRLFARRVGRVRRLAFLNILLTLLTVEYESIHA